MIKFKSLPRFSLGLPLALSCAALNAQTEAPIDPNPTVVSGAVGFSGLETPNAVITQDSLKAIVDYDHFNVLPGGSVQFVQPGAEAMILNRITGATPSLIEGLVTANGQLYFVNPAGVTFGEGSVIRADTFLAAAGDLANEDFLAGNLEFTLSGDVTNHGSIETAGAAALLGRQVLNTGEIISRDGVAVLASGDEVFLQPIGSSLLVRVSDDGSTLRAGVGVDNSGSVAGDEVLFAAGDAYAMALSHSGSAEAGSVAKLHADGGAIEVSGTVSAPGGVVEIGGTDLGGPGAPRASATTLTDSAVVDVSSEAGKGGHAVVWSDGTTTMRGVIDAEGAARGGSVEVSGATLDFGDGLWGLSVGDGSILLDPTDVTIDAPLATNIVSTMNGGGAVTVTTAVAGADAGDINVTAPIQVTNTANQGTLTMFADNNIVIGANITSLQPNAGGTVFDFTAGNDIQVNALVQAALTSFSAINLAATNTVVVSGTGSVDAGGSAVSISGDQGITLQTGAQVLAGINTSVGNLVTLSAPNGTVDFNGGLVQTFGGTDVIVTAERFTNTTGVNAITSIGGAGFWQIVLPHPYGETATTNAHAYGGLLSNNPAIYNSAGTGDPVRNEYHYGFQPVIDVTANDDSKIYGDAPNAGFMGVTVDSTDLVNAAAFGGVFTQDTLGGSVAGTASRVSPGTPTTSAVGDYAITASGLTSPNGYAFNYIAGTLTVDPRAVTLTATQQEKDYGDSLTYDDTAFTVLDKDGDAVLPNGETIDTATLVSATGVDASTTADAGTYVDEITVTGQSGSSGFVASNYDFTYVAGDLVVDQRAITVTATQQEKYYGDNTALGDTAFSVLDKDADALLPNGELIETVSVTSVTNKDTSTIAAAATYSDELQPTAVSGSNGFTVSNYDITFVNGDYVITPRPITLTATTQNKDYGDALDLGGTAFTITDLDTDALLPNGETVETVSFNSATAVDASTTAAVGTYVDEITITGQTGANGFSAANYAITYVDGDLVVDPRAITVTATQQEKIYGDTLALDATAFTVLDKDGDAALPNGESIDTATLVSQTGGDASTTAVAGTYVDEIRGTGVTGSNGYANANYTITFVDGDLVVNPRAVTLTASEQEKIYGDGLTLDDTAFTLLDKDGDSALPNGEMIETATLISATGVDASTTTSAGTYVDEITITGQSGSNGFDAGNYDLTYVAGPLVVNRRAVTLTALSQEKDYGDPLTLDGTVFSVTDLDGDAVLPNAEMIDTVALVSQTGVDASTSVDVGTYVDEIAITGQSGSNGFDAANYTLTYVDGDLAVVPRAITLTASTQNKIFGDTLTLDSSAFTTMDKDGDAALPNGEVVSSVVLVSNTGVDARTSAGVGTYVDEISITGQTGASGFDAGNYTITYVDGDFVVGKRSVTLSAGPQSKTYGDVLMLDGQVFTVTDMDGDAALPNGETVVAVNLVSTTGVDASTSADVGTYPDEIAITGQTGANGFDAANYALTYVEGDLSVTPRPLSLTATAQSKTYGEVITLDGTAFVVTDRDGGSALPNGETVASVTLASAAGNASTADVGTYVGDLSITGQSGANGFDATNYDITYAAGDFAVHARSITLTASDRERLYYEAWVDDPTAFTVMDADGDSSLPNGETLTGATITSVGDLATSPTTLPDTYPDNLVITGQMGGNGFDAGNYTIAYLPGDLKITGSIAPGASFMEAFSTIWDELMGISRIEKIDTQIAYQPDASLLLLYGDPDWDGLSEEQRRWFLRQYDRTPPHELSRVYLFELLRQAKAQ